MQNVIDKRCGYASIGGGGGNWTRTNGAYATISGGWSNIIGSNLNNDDATMPSVVAGGWRNIIENNSAMAVIGGGRFNLIFTNSHFGTIAGGADNQIKALTPTATIGGGIWNTNAGESSTIAGGHQNSTAGVYATVPGGSLNNANGAASLAAGYRAKANHNGSFVWGDYTAADVASTAANQFIVRATGGVWLGTNSSPSIGANRFIDTASGGNLTHGGIWSNNSDRKTKENFQSIDSKKVLKKLVSMPVTSWNYKVEGSDIRHIGPVAQDFHAAFRYGGDEKSISTADASGVAFAAIQGLYEMLRERDKELSELKEELQQLKGKLGQ